MWQQLKFCHCPLGSPKICLKYLTLKSTILLLHSLCKNTSVIIVIVTLDLGFCSSNLGAKIRLLNFGLFIDRIDSKVDDRGELIRASKFDHKNTTPHTATNNHRQVYCRATVHLTFCNLIICVV